MLNLIPGAGYGLIPGAGYGLIPGAGVMSHVPGAGVMSHVPGAGLMAVSQEQVLWRCPRSRSNEVP